MEAFELTETRNEDTNSDSDNQINIETKEVTPKLSNLPTLSVSSPSPPHEEQLL